MNFASYLSYCLLAFVVVVGLFLVFGTMAINHAAGRDDDDDDTP